MTLDELKTKLRGLSDHGFTEHDDLFGENPDDAYQYGVADGRAEMAAEILQELERK